MPASEDTPAGRGGWLVFISHASTDTWVAKRIAEEIEERGGKVFLDEADIKIGDDFEDRILQALARADELLVLLTPWAVLRPYIWVEVGAAWGRRTRIIFILHGLTSEELQTRPEIPVIIKRRDLIDLNSLDTYLAELEERIRGNTEA